MQQERMVDLITKQERMVDLITHKSIGKGLKDFPASHSLPPPPTHILQIFFLTVFVRKSYTVDNLGTCSHIQLHLQIRIIFKMLKMILHLTL